jgi:quercetin dioxygenase-like cupin family protein
VGEILERPGRRLEVKHAGEELMLFEFVLQAHTDGAGPHHHRQHTDSFYVLEGELELLLDGETVTARPGDLIAVTRGRTHGFRNASDAPVRFLNMHTPGMRFDEYIRKMDAGEQPDPAEYDSFD